MGRFLVVLGVGGWLAAATGCGDVQDCAATSCGAGGMGLPGGGMQTVSAPQGMGPNMGGDLAAAGGQSAGSPAGGGGPGGPPAGTDGPGPAGDGEGAGPTAPSASAPGVGDGSVPTDGPTASSDAGMPMVGPDPSASVWRPDPAWDCGLPGGIPVPADGDPVFTVDMDVEVFDLGETQYGTRQVLHATAGRVSGDGVTGQVLAGAYDYQLVLDNGVLEVEQIGVLRLEGGNVFFRSCGVAPDAGTPARVIADFEAGTRGRHAGLNGGRYVGERRFNAADGQLVLEFYAHEGETGTDRELLAIRAPATSSRQAWDCPAYTGQPGELVYRESVGIGGSVSVGASKYGTRNIIPITGGTTRDRLPGEVLPGGADYQLVGDTFFLDARYVIRTDDGVLVAVRNCGPASSLVPTFETREDGPYAFLNENVWLSSSPSISIGAVNLTIYERRE